MKNCVGILILLAGVLCAQAAKEVAPLKYWPAPLYWHPSHQESATAAKPAQTPANSLVFVAMTPCRVADTRTGFGFTGAFGPPSLVGGAVRGFPIQASTTCTIPSIAQAYSFNITVVTSSFLNYLTVYPFGAAQPNVSTLNDDLGTVVANAAVVGAGSDSSGSVNVYASNNADLIIDINGYYAAQSGITLTQGSQSAPSLSFAGDSLTGIYSPGPGVIDFVATGVQAMSVGSSQNTALGLYALSGDSTGTGNTALGYEALASNTFGETNTAIGYQALAFANAAAANTAVGYGAMSAMGGGGLNNTAVGFGALENNTTGGGNIAIGSGAGSANAGSALHNIDIGSSGGPADSGTVRIGTPSLQTLVFVAGVEGVMTGVNNAVPVLIDSNGQLGTASSSARYKEDIRDMGDASSGLAKLRPVTFRYKKPYADGSKPVDYGLIAEEVAQVYPDLVVRNADGEIETVQYQKLTPMLLNELQKLQERVAALEKMAGK